MYVSTLSECEEQMDIFWMIGGEFQDGKDLNKHDGFVFSGSCHDVLKIDRIIKIFHA